MAIEVGHGPIGNLIINAANLPVVANGSTSSRTLASRFGQVANVQDFGAVPDGGTTDNAAAIEAAAASISGKKGTLYFPNGTSYYGVARPVAIVGDEYSGLTIAGDGPNSWVKLTADPTSFDTVSGVQIHGVLTVAGSVSLATDLDGLTVRNLRLSGYSESTSPAPLYKVLTLARVKNAVIEGCEFDTSRYEGLYVVNGQGQEPLTIRGNYFHNIGGFATVGGWGLAAINPGTNNVVIEANRVENVAQFIECNTDYVVIRGNHFRNSVRGNGNQNEGIVVRLTNVNAAGDPKKAIIRDNVVENAQWIRVNASGAGSARILVQNNQLYKATIWVEYDATIEDVLIADNQITEPVADATSTAIRLDTVGVIRNNVVRSISNRWSVFVRLDVATTENITVRDNTFIGTPSTSGVDSSTLRHEMINNSFVGWADNVPRYYWGAAYAYNPDHRVWASSFPFQLSSVNRSRMTVTSSALPPDRGSFKVGDIIEYKAPTAGTFMGEVCTAAGTFGTLAGITGSIDIGTTALTLSTTPRSAGIGTGSVITIAGVAGNKTVTAMAGGNVVTIDSAASATVSDAAVQYVAPTFKTFGPVTA